MPTKHASAVALEAFTEAALAARRHPAVVCSQAWRAGAATLAGATAA